MQAPRFCTTSWDDGHPLDLRVAELLAKYGLTGTFYVPIENSREVMTPGQVRQLAANFEVGAHTINHVVLTEVSGHTAEREIRDSRKRLEEITGGACEGFCFPKGRFRRAHLEMVRRSGFRFARTVELLSVRPPIRRAGMFVVPTTVQAVPNPWRAYAKNGAKRLAVRNLFRSFRHSWSGDWVRAARSMMQIVARQGGVFHLWGHSWEVEGQCQWFQLESVLREMQELRSVMPCVPNAALIQPDLAGSAETLPMRCDS